MNDWFRQKRLLAFLVAAFVGLSVGAVNSAWARGGWGCMNANVTPEQSAQLFDLKQQFMNDTSGLRRQMAVKRAELAALWRSEAPDQNQIQVKQQEVNALREQFQAKRNAFRLQTQKICPQAGMDKGRGSGRGMGQGKGMAMGPGGQW